MNAPLLERQRTAELLASLADEPDTATCDYEGRTQKLLPLVSRLTSEEAEPKLWEAMYRAALRYDAQDLLDMVQREIRQRVEYVVVCELPDVCQREVERIREMNLGQREERMAEERVA